MPDEVLEAEEEELEEPEEEAPEETYDVGDQEDADKEEAPKPKPERSVESLWAENERMKAKIAKLEAQRSEGGLTAEDRTALERAKRISAELDDKQQAAAPAKPYPSIYDDDQAALAEVERRAVAASRIDEDYLVERITQRVVSQSERAKGIAQSTKNLEAVKAKYPSLQNTEAHNRMVRLIDSQLGADGLVSAQVMEQMARIVDPTLAAVDRTASLAEAEDRIMAQEDAAERAAAVAGKTGGAGGKRNLLTMAPDRIASVLGNMKDTKKASELLRKLEAKDPVKYAAVMEEIDPDLQD